MDREKLILDIMKECEQDGEPVTRAEAEEMADMELKSKETRHYEKSDKKRKKSTPKERKVDEKKAFLLQILIESVKSYVDITKAKNEAEFGFIYENDDFTVKLIKHRKGK